MYTIVTRNQCNFCDTAKALLQGLGIEYQELNVQESRWLLDLVKKAGYTTVPQIWDHNGQHVGGYTELKERLVP
jgi:glutaredoxin